MSYPITDIEGIDAETAAILRSVGIRSTGRLLELANTMKGRKLLAEKTGIDCKQFLCWANVADRMRIRGVSKEYADLLHAAGVDTVRELKYRNPARLAKSMAEAINSASWSACCHRKRSSAAGSSTPRSCRSRSRISGALSLSRHSGARGTREPGTRRFP